MSPGGDPIRNIQARAPFVDGCNEAEAPATDGGQLHPPQQQYVTVTIPPPPIAYDRVSPASWRPDPYHKPYHPLVGCNGAERNRIDVGLMGIMLLIAARFAAAILNPASLVFSPNPLNSSEAPPEGA